MSDVFEWPPVIPVVVIEDAAAAVELAHALMSGGILCAEITLRTPAGVASIAAIASTLGDVFMVGAGTVVHPGQLKEVAAAGARFAVSPGFDDELVERMQSSGLEPLPGTATATEVQRAMRAGIDAVKFFPADRLGGIETIRALSAPFLGMHFIPSGGVSPQNLAEYLRHPQVPAVCGSWMVPAELIRAGRFDTIAQRAREATELAATAMGPGLDRQTVL
ncbi:bifunctional 4-hydroxy-2-oxoglutarate aldolase/2-dehydro-3-deoxy-phosphogluconate aldolase [Leifsonia shinshuensis]|uniref:bifunctional 4-hydroxy-2-oxoglutarate aldolase/2-dehydro-3-deoxy-phosphogluconate aldolase n=1 Tax=Leifsonia shinshuensis TaxID=150026 RepID=UPI00285950D4|nr:bifunctional 4-hydroxy-2-oxoglutarate aldolase/2-dehydro-3-deoxy-phosphogluconate aldolase [Leifsonia shinshuensis]MDR6972830.1 2-dehydro-3-deoxyphosphogluconate aldolase/(4S)-4-hydroxy-2-oxoglutarate aldolase [Leifsonia shinshuensis]